MGIFLYSNKNHLSQRPKRFLLSTTKHIISCEQTKYNSQYIYKCIWQEHLNNHSNCNEKQCKSYHSPHIKPTAFLYYFNICSQVRFIPDLLHLKYLQHLFLSSLVLYDSKNDPPNPAPCQESLS